MIGGFTLLAVIILAVALGNSDRNRNENYKGHLIQDKNDNDLRDPYDTEDYDGITYE